MNNISMLWLNFIDRTTGNGIGVCAGGAPNMTDNPSPLLDKLDDMLEIPELGLSIDAL